ncbi:MAG: histidine kinase [Pseudonocardiales bacterium]|nr:histidine kinase [Pseudonocardiales bacterium]
MLVLALCACGVAGVEAVATAPAPVPPRVAASVAVVAATLLTAWLLVRRTRPTRAVTVAPLLLAALLLVPYTVGSPWPGQAGLLVAGLLVAFPPRAALPLSLLVVLGAAAAELTTTPPDVVRAVLVVADTVALGLALFGLSLLVQAVGELAEAREELARVAAVQERERLSRDVHDLLGMSLSAIALKCELTVRLLPPDAGLARTQLDEVLALARRALADVRQVTHGGAPTGLDDELDNAQDALTAVDVRVRLDRAAPCPGGPAGAALAAVLREGVTNVLRHSDASWCAIAIRTEGGAVHLEIVNDGVRPARPGGRAGTGLRNLAERTAAVGGVLCAETDGRVHRLRASVPAPDG